MSKSRVIYLYPLWWVNRVEFWVIRGISLQPDRPGFIPCSVTHQFCGIRCLSLAEPLFPCLTGEIMIDPISRAGCEKKRRQLYSGIK